VNSLERKERRVLMKIKESREKKCMKRKKDIRAYSKITLPYFDDFNFLNQ
jgi:hypothetical protein